MALDKVTAAFHFAAHSDVGLSVEGQKWDIEINARGSIDPVK